MKSKLKFAISALVWALMLMAAYVVSMHAQTDTTANQPAKKGRAAQTFGINPAGTSRGTAVLLAKFVGDGSVAFDSNVIEAKLGNTSVGTTTPASKLTVKEMIETTLGGLKFPDGTLQSVSAGKTPLFTVAHDETLQGDGTSVSLLGIKFPLNLNGSLTVNGDIQANTIKSGDSFVSGVLDVGSLIRAHTASGSAVEATGGSGEFDSGASGIKATGGNGQRSGGAGVEAHGGVSQESTGGVGVEAHGADGVRSQFGDQLGGNGVVGIGGQSNFIGATGVLGFGGGSDTGFGGNGMLAIGGRSNKNKGGIGAEIVGGDSGNGDGGKGLVVVGGDASGSGHISGDGIVARAGTPFNGAEKGLAGEFDGNLEVFGGDLLVFGNVRITGNLSKGSGSFKIDHPLDPENKYLSHSFVESPDMMNIYNGTVRTDANGSATVTLPDWFEALNQDFRYQLTVIGTFAQAIVAEEIKGNRFVVKTSAPNVKVSWQVTGIRHDAYANKHRIAVEEQKAEKERGLYLHPDAFNQPPDPGVQVVRNAPQIERSNLTSEQARRQSGQR